MRNVLLVVAFMMFYIGYRHRGNDVRPSPPSRSGNGNDVVTPAATTHPENVHPRGRRGILVLNKTPGIEVRFSSESHKRILSQNAKAHTTSSTKTPLVRRAVQDRQNRTRSLKMASQQEKKSKSILSQRDSKTSLFDQRQKRKKLGNQDSNNDVDSQAVKEIRERTMGPHRLQSNQTTGQNTTYKTSANNRKDMAGVNGDHIPQPNPFDINDTVFPDFDMEAIDVNLTMLPTDGNWSLDGDITTDVDFDFFLRKEHNQSLGSLIDNEFITDNNTFVASSIHKDSKDFKNNSKTLKEDCEVVSVEKLSESRFSDMESQVDQLKGEEDHSNQLHKEHVDTLQLDSLSSEDNIGADELLQSLLTLLQRDDAVHELETDVEHETNHEDSDDISSNIYLDYQNDGDDEFKVDTEYDFSDHDESEQSDGIKRVIKLDRYAHVVSCQINVACNLGSPNRRCKCRPNNRQKPGTESNASCVFPKARVTHRSLTKKGLLTSFCFGVSLPALGRRYKYDMRTKCTFYGRPNVTYKVYVSKAVKGSARSKKGRTVRYKACLRPVQ
ncbi:uncharacterized protein LOC144906181 [Branchiostoma floridae x Branchiostoma belcheri]